MNRYNKEKVVFAMGDIIATISNMLPASMTLEDFDLDVVQTEEGSAISGRIAGFATSDEIIASLVTGLQTHKPFSSVSMDYSKSRTVHNIRAREFRISFLIDLNNNWDVSRMVVVGGDE